MLLWNLRAFADRRNWHNTNTQCFPSFYTLEFPIYLFLFPLSAIYHLSFVLLLLLVFLLLILLLLLLAKTNKHIWQLSPAVLEEMSSPCVVGNTSCVHIIERLMIILMICAWFGDLKKSLQSWELWQAHWHGIMLFVMQSTWTQTYVACKIRRSWSCYCGPVHIADIVWYDWLCKVDLDSSAY